MYVLTYFKSIRLPHLMIIRKFIIYFLKGVKYKNITCIKQVFYFVNVTFMRNYCNNKRKVIAVVSGI